MSVRDIEERCNRGREQMRATASEVGAKLSPGQMVDSILKAGHQGQGFISRVRHEIADNPLLASLAGPALSWLVFSKRKVKEGIRKAEDSVQRAPAPAQSGDGEPPGIDFYRDTAHDIAAKVEGRFHDVAGKAEETIKSVKHSAERGLNRAFAFARNEPYVLLGAGLALGAALGAYAPTTDAESETIGEAGDAIMREAHSALDQAKVIGKDIYERMSGEPKAP